MTDTQFEDLSIELTKKLSLKTKKDNGIYFTPKSIIAKNMDDIFWIKSISLHGVRFMIYLTDNKCKESFTQQDHFTYYNGRPDFNDLCCVSYAWLVI